MDYSELRSSNPRLLWDGICRGRIPYSEGEALQTGTVVTNTFIESFVGGPIPPENSSYNPLTTDIIGPGTGYPKPWRSYSQNAQNISYGSGIGPYAKLVRLPDVDQYDYDLPNTCVDGFPRQCGGSGGGIYGRIGFGNGQRLGFRAQDWYNQEEGPYDTAYYNTARNNDPKWLTWKKWWDGASKVTIPAIWVINQFDSYYVDVEVATSTPDLGDNSYFPGPNLNGVADASYNLLVAMVANVATTRWII